MVVLQPKVLRQVVIITMRTTHRTIKNLAEQEHAEGNGQNLVHVFQMSPLALPPPGKHNDNREQLEKRKTTHSLNKRTRHEKNTPHESNYSM